MSLTNTACRQPYQGNGVTTSFATVFTFLENSDVSVIVTANGVNTTLAQGTDYTLTGAQSPGGGTVVCTGAPASGTTVTILRTTPLTQQTTFEPNDSLPSPTLENGLDKLTMIAQELLSPGGSVARSLQLPVTEPIGANTQLPPATARANGILSFDPNGNITIGQGLGKPRGNYVPGTAYNAHDIFTDAATQNIYQAAVNYTAVSIVADLAAGDIVLVLNAVLIASGISGSVTPIAPWSTGVNYALGNIVYYADNKIYRCAVAHTAGVFATDLAAGKWINLAPSTVVATFAVDAGVTNAYVVNPSPAPTSLTAGLVAQFITTNANNAAATLNFSGFGVKSIVKKGATALAAGDIAAGVVNLLQYDGTNWQLLNPPALQPANNLSDVANVSAARASLGLGSAAVLNTGTSAGNIVQLDGSSRLPAVDGSQLTNVSTAGANLVTLTSSGTWTVPAGITKVKATVIGGGGGGYSGPSGGYGGGGGAVFGYLTGLTPGAGIAYTIGAGGTGNTNPNPATAGGSSFISSFTAGGGQPGDVTYTGGTATGGLINVPGGLGGGSVGRPANGSAQGGSFNSIVAIGTYGQSGAPGLGNNAQPGIIVLEY